MGKHLMDLFVNFVVRALVGAVLIYFVNQFLMSKGIMTQLLLIFYFHPMQHFSQKDVKKENAEAFSFALII